MAAINRQYPLNVQSFGKSDDDRIYKVDTRIGITVHNLRRAGQVGRCSGKNRQFAVCHSAQEANPGRIIHITQNQIGQFRQNYLRQEHIRFLFHRKSAQLMQVVVFCQRGQ